MTSAREELTQGVKQEAIPNSIKIFAGVIEINTKDFGLICHGSVGEFNSMSSHHFWDLFRIILCAFNWGAICFVQIVHYPLFSEVGRDNFVPYHQLHVARTSLFLGATLTIEMILNLGLVLLKPFSWNEALPIAFSCIGWIVTFFMSVPQHRKLENGFSEKAHRNLLISNWIRVVCWGGALGALSVRFRLPG